MRLEAKNEAIKKKDTKMLWEGLQDVAEQMSDERKYGQ